MFHGALLLPFLFWGPGHGLFTLLAVIFVFSLIFRRRHYYYYGHPWWGGGRDSRSEAREILESRYAKGEIQREEYLQKKQDLG
jgi:putative membrane protein